MTVSLREQNSWTGNGKRHAHVLPRSHRISEIIKKSNFWKETLACILKGQIIFFITKTIICQHIGTRSRMMPYLCLLSWVIGYRSCMNRLPYHHAIFPAIFSHNSKSAFAFWFRCVISFICSPDNVARNFKEKKNSSVIPTFGFVYS